MVKMA